MDPLRYLGFAFASADLLFEIDAAGKIVFAVGATRGLTRQSESDLVDKSWRDIVAQDDQPMVEAMFAGLETGRCGPITVALPGDAERRFATLSACRLPAQPRIACAMALSAAAPIAARSRTDAYGYQDRTEFEVLAKSILGAAATVGQELDIALIELPGLSAALADQGANQAALLRTLAGALRAEAFGGAAAARLSEQRFAVIREKATGPERIEHRLGRALAAVDSARDLTAQAQILAIEPGVGSLDRSLRAMRYAIEGFADKGVEGLAAASLGEAFTRSVQQTLERAGEFGAVIRARRFNLVFMPIVSLASGRCEHYETLVRFEDDTSPYKLIRMAEELDLILELDLAIAEQTLRTLKTDKRRGLRLAINVSGRSIMDPWFIDEVGRMTKAYGVEPPRLILEITESVEINDLALADGHIQTLRQAGHRICLDDFGAGATSYGYLQKLHVDVVKIDGRYVKKLAENGRDAALVRHLVNLCDELHVETVAEMITSPEIEQAARAAGVTFGQGYLYGQPTAEPDFKPRPKQNPRRKGEDLQWG